MFESCQSDLIAQPKFIAQFIAQFMAQFALNSVPLVTR